MTTARQHLAQLEASGLVHLARLHPELEYLFRHALVQDAAYSSLLKQDRRRLHGATAEALELAYPDRLDELAPLLAHHFHEAGDARALKYYTLAGDYAARRHANAEAVAHYSRALDMARTGMAQADSEQLRHIFMSRGRAMELSGRYDDAVANYQEMEMLGREREDRALELAALTAITTIYSTPTAKLDAGQSQSLSGRALALARDLGDRQAEAKILWNLMLAHIFTGRYLEAVQHGERSLSIARELDLREQLAYTLNDIYRCYLGTGQMERAMEVMEESRELWRELDNLPMLADNLSSTARLYFEIGNYEQAIAFANQACRTSETTGNLWGQAFCRTFVCYVYVERGEMATAIELMKDAIRFGEQSGFMVVQASTRADLGWVYGTLGAVEQGLELASQGVGIARQGLPTFAAWTLASLARLYTMKGDIAAAEATLRKSYDQFDPESFHSHAMFYVPFADAELGLAKGDYARAVAATDRLLGLMRKTGIRAYITEALYLNGRALLAQGLSTQAKEALEEARRLADGMGLRRTLWPVLMLLSRLVSQEGDQTEAERLRAQAQEIVRYIAGNIGAPELHDSFLALPDVQATLGPEGLVP